MEHILENVVESLWENSLVYESEIRVTAFEDCLIFSPTKESCTVMIFEYFFNIGEESVRAVSVHIFSTLIPCSC